MGGGYIEMESHQWLNSFSLADQYQINAEIPKRVEKIRIWESEAGKYLNTIFNKGMEK